MLDHHPRLACHFEYEFAVERMADDGQLPEMNAFCAYLRRDRVFQLSGSRIDDSLEYRDLVESFLIQKAGLKAKEIVGATVHYNFHRLRFLWPQAKYIYLLRDGRDVAKSCIQQGWAGNFYTGVNSWIAAEQSWTQLQQFVPPDRRVEVRFEDLVCEPEARLREICEFLGVEFSQEMLDYPKFSTYKGPDAKAANRWRRFDSRDVALAESRIRPMLAERGYELSANPPIALGWLRRKTLLMDDRWQKFRFRINRFGLPLACSDYIARHIGARSWAARCRERIDEITNQHLD